MKRFSALLCALALIATVSQPTLAQKVKPKIRISKETTYIDGPLTKDGYIDYVSHLNAILSDGVTPQNNSAALLLQTYPGEIRDDKYMARYCKALGIKKLPVEGDYFQNMGTYAQNQAEKKAGRKISGKERADAVNSFNDEYGKVDDLWTADQFPQVAKWIEANEKHLAQIAKAAKRTRYYHPMLLGDDEEYQSMIMILLPQAQGMRSFARCLSVRALLYAGEGKYKEALEDLLTMRRLGNHVSQGATLVEQLVGIAIIGITQGAEQKIALSGKLPVDLLVDYQAKLDKNRCKANMIRSFGECERFMFLDSVQQVMRGGLMNLEMMTSGAASPKTATRRMLDRLVQGSTDWAETMKVGNQLYDKYISRLKTEKSWSEQHRIVAELETEIQKMTESVGSTYGITKALLGGPEYRGKTMGKIFVSLLMPALNAASGAEKRGKIMDDVTKIVIAVAAYKTKKGNYPDNLGQLETSGMIKSLPIDRYSDSDFVYRKKDGGFIVYSVGVNGKDDNGNGVFNEARDRGDDFAGGWHSIKNAEKETPASPF